jgi:esterase/lipase superfamily enzyme
LLLGNEPSPGYELIEKSFRKSIEDDESVGATVPAAQTRFYLAKMFFCKGDSDRAHKMMTNLRNCFEKYEIPVWRQKCDHELEPYHF